MLIYNQLNTQIDISLKGLIFVLIKSACCHLFIKHYLCDNLDAWKDNHVRCA